MGSLHALVVPFPLQGHISPLLQLSQHLVGAHGFFVTFVNTEYYQKVYEEEHPQGPGPGIRMVGLSDGLPLDAPRRSSEDVGKLMQSLPRHMKPLLEQLLIAQQNNPVCCIIADIFMPWVHSINAKAVPFLGFHVSSIAQFAVICRLPHLIATGQISAENGSVKNAQLDRVTVVPGLLDFDVENIPWCGGNPEEDAHLFHFLTVVQKHVPLCNAMLFNSFSELEGKLLDTLTEESKMKMLPVGPLFLHNHDDDQPLQNGYGVMSRHDKACWEWLQGKAKGSVLYISFGTTAWLSREELREVALGVEAAQVFFMWVVRGDLVMGEEAVLPAGFAERTKEKGFFTPWAPQMLVLSHPAVGAFLTHGGWNSVLEAICMGVPMLTCPYGFDQKGNSQLIVENWKLGLPLRNRNKGVTKEEVERLVTCIMKSREGKHLRERVTTLKCHARLAFGQGGSSSKNFQDIIRTVQRDVYHNG